MNIFKTFEWSYYSHFETIGVHIILENFRSFEQLSTLDVRRLGDTFQNYLIGRFI